MPTPKPTLYAEAYNLQVGDAKPIIARDANRGIYVFASSQSKFTTLEQVKAAYREFQAAPAEWEDYLRTRFKVHVVRKRGAIFTCTCPEGSRKRICKHALHIMCSPDIALYSYPPEALAVPLAKKKKVGRPKKIPVQNRYAASQ